MRISDLRRHSRHSAAIRLCRCKSMTSRKKPGVAFWATVALVAVVVGYPLSMGPYWRLCHEVQIPQPIRDGLDAFYEPVWEARWTGPEFVQLAVGGYLNWWTSGCRSLPVD